MTDVNIAKFTPNPCFGNVKIGDMFQDIDDYWYMKVKIKDSDYSEGETVFALGLEDGKMFNDFRDENEIRTFFTPSTITIQ